MQQSPAVTQWPQAPAPAPAGMMMMMMPMQPSAPNVWRISRRSTLFKAGIVLMVLSVIIFIIGYSAPAWVGRAGLFMHCVDGRCNTLNSQVGWFNGVRVFETLALLCFLVAVAVEFYQDVCQSPPSPRENQLVEIFTAVASGFTLLGIIIFAAQVNLYPTANNMSVLIQYTRADYFYFNGPIRLSLNWGFGLTTGAGGTGLISAFLITYSRARDAGKATQAAWVQPPMAMTPMQPMPAGANYLAGPAPYSVSSQIPQYYLLTDGNPLPVFSGSGSSTSVVPGATAITAAAPAVAAAAPSPVATANAESQQVDSHPPPAYQPGESNGDCMGVKL